jgi:hypothetical protein
VVAREDHAPPLERLSPARIVEVAGNHRKSGVGRLEGGAWPPHARKGDKLPGL